jgi:hypothetical protein
VLAIANASTDASATAIANTASNAQASSNPSGSTSSTAHASGTTAGASSATMSSTSSKANGTRMVLNNGSLSNTGADDATGITALAASLVAAGGLFGFLALAKRRRQADSASAE